MWEVRLRPLHECNGHTIFFRFLDYLALQRVNYPFLLTYRTRSTSFRATGYTAYGCCMGHGAFDGA